MKEEGKLDTVILFDASKTLITYNFQNGNLNKKAFLKKRSYRINPGYIRSIYLDIILSEILTFSKQSNTIVHSDTCNIS